MMEKYRVHEVAKDLEVPNKDVMDVVSKHNPDAQYKHMTALSNDELNVIFETYTQGNEVESFDAYFAQGEEARKQKNAPAPQPAPTAPVQQAKAPETAAKAP